MTPALKELIMSLATLVTGFTLAFLWPLPIPVGQGSPGPAKSTQSQLRAVGLHLGVPEGPHHWQGSSSLPRRARGNAVPSGRKSIDLGSRTCNARLVSSPQCPSLCPRPDSFPTWTDDSTCPSLPQRDPLEYPRLACPTALLLGLSP